jgi:hypothetical protein
MGLDPAVAVIPLEEVAVNVETAEPPVALAVNGIEITPLPDVVAVPIVGACGTVVAVMLLEADDALEVPAAEVAVTVNVYAVAD